MTLRNIDIFFTLLLNLIQYGTSEYVLPCNSSLIGECPGPNQACNATLKVCVCLKGFVRDGDDCVPPTSDSTSYSGVTVAIVIILTLALLISGVILVVRKYNLVDYIRQRLLRRGNDVMYEDVMIGNDDPPLSP